MTTQSYSDKISSLFREIERGRQGLNIGVSTGMPKLDQIISGLQRQTFYLIGGTTGSGKSTLALYSAIYYPLVYEGKLGTDMYNILFYSLEMTAEMLYAKLLSMYISDQHGLDLTYNQILSRGEILEDSYYTIVLESRKWLEEVQKHLTIFDKTLTTEALAASLTQYAKENGKFVESQDNRTNTYIPNVENAYTIVILDHVGLIRTMNGQSKKDAADIASDLLISFRNKCGYTPMVIMQLNRQASSMDRRNENMQEPELQDFKGSGGPGEAAEVVLALFYPHREKMTSWKNYNMRIMRDKFRAIFCLKNRFGIPDQAVPVSFFGNVGIFREMPKPEEIGEDYRPYLTPTYRVELAEVIEQDANGEKEQQLFTL